VLTVKFDHALSPGEIAGLEGEGVEFYYIDGRVARTRSIYPVRIAWSQIDRFSDRADVVRMESAWQPCVFPTLDVSGPEIQADSCWLHADPLALPLTGRGKRICDFDTGIDVFHPSFFFADGDTLDWLDVDGNHGFTPGTDAVDINGDGIAGGGETLRFTDGWISDYANVFSGSDRSNADNIYQTYWDWLYADTNNNFVRDYGPADGFTESDPTFGEPWFIALDDNENGQLDVGEKLVALGTSKIHATLNTGSVERLRGIDLIESDDDTNGHGTAVSGILAGGTPGRHRFAGIAPDAELLAGNVFSDVPLSLLIPWARSRGADVMLYEYGSYTYQFLDGSSLSEELVTAEHATTLQVTPSGNLARGAKHAVATIAGLDSVSLKIRAPFYNGAVLHFYSTTIWRPVAHTDLSFKLKYPQGIEWALADSVSYLYNYEVWYDREVSPRGTHKFDMFVDRGYQSNVLGNWELKIINHSYHPVEIISNVSDDNSSWAGGTEFQNYVSNTRNVTSPATADSSLVNGSYSTRGFEGYGGVGSGTIPPGEISAFSGRGKRIDGASQLDLCTPGNYDVYTTRTHTDALRYPPGGYRQFSGTSAAGPHAAAGAALLHQMYPAVDPGQVEHMLKTGAFSDSFTGTVPNETWGYGKLRILNSMRVATAVTDMADGRRTPQLHVGQNYPNPFNPSTWIPFYLPADGVTRLVIYNVRGEVVRTLRDRWYHEGAHSVVWNGRDNKGSPVASGVYFSVLRQNGLESTRKMVLIR
jgi:hypothetical protein